MSNSTTAVHSIDELRIRQALPLDVKVNMTKTRIREWVDAFGVDGVYVSFSGGKDSTVLLHIVREMYPTIPAVFVDTGLEYPEIREFVKTFDNVEWIRPQMTFRKVIEKYGYPFISKEVSQKVREARNDKESYCYKSFIPEEEGGRPKPYNYSKYSFMLEGEYKFSEKCCTQMKKKPSEQYERLTKRKPILGMMAAESMARVNEWLRYGCNSFEKKRQSSKPMAFWTEQDVLQYIQEHGLKIATVYGDIVIDYGEELQGQMDIAELGLAKETRPLVLTGCKRTGCMFCGYGCQCEKEGEGRFERMKETHPKQYEYIMRKWEDGGLGYKEVIDWLNENGDLHIRY